MKWAYRNNREQQHTRVQSFQSSIREWAPFLALGSLWSLMLVVWQALDRQALLPDMAYHWWRAHAIRHALAAGGSELLAPLQSYYPPLFSLMLGLLEFVLPFPWPLIALHTGGGLLAGW